MAPVPGGRRHERRGNPTQGSRDILRPNPRHPSTLPFLHAMGGRWVGERAGSGTPGVRGRPRPIGCPSTVPSFPGLSPSWTRVLPETDATHPNVRVEGDPDPWSNYRPSFDLPSTQPLSHRRRDLRQRGKGVQTEKKVLVDKAPLARWFHLRASKRRKTRGLDDGDRCHPRL